MSFKDWSDESRANFLLLPVVLIVLGAGVAHYENGTLNLLHVVLAFIGLVMMHIAVNVLNEVSDYKTGIDFNTTRTPFSGGTGVLVAGKISLTAATRYAWINIGLATLIGAYFIWVMGWNLLPLLIAGAVLVIFYTPFMGRVVLGEIAAGLGLGLLPVMGAHYVFSGDYSFMAFAAAVPPFFLVFNLLFLNEFPDLEADTIGGRKHLIILFGKYKSAWIYSAALAMVYIWQLIAVFFGWIPAWSLLGLLTLPIAINIWSKLFKNLDNFEGFVPLQGQNVMVVLLTHLLMGIGFFIA